MSLKPKIFYFCYDHNIPAGGEKHSYQHVEVLAKQGYNAFILHRKPGFRLTWFENSAEVVGEEQFNRVYNPVRDYIVFPEDLGNRMLEYPGRRVIFNKNVFHGYEALGLEDRDPYLDPATAAVLAVSEHNAAHLRMSYPSLPVLRVYSSIRLDLFRHTSSAEKERLICCADKNLPHALAVYRAFCTRASNGLNAGQQWRWEFLTGKTENEVAALLRAAAALLFTSINEGLPRLPIEAMACGATVIAYRAGPLLEIAPDYLQTPYGDITGLTRALERLVADFEGEPSRLASFSEQGLRIAQAFTAERQERSVSEAWETILGGSRRPEKKLSEVGQV